MTTQVRLAHQAGVQVLAHVAVHGTTVARLVAQALAGVLAVIQALAGVLVTVLAVLLVIGNHGHR